MPRIQVMHLPAPPDDYPFIVIIDEIDADASEGLAGLAERIGAKAVVSFEQTVEVV